MWVFEESPKGWNDMAKIEKNQKIFSLLVFKVTNPWLLEYALLLTLSTRGKNCSQGNINFSYIPQKRYLIVIKKE